MDPLAKRVARRFSAACGYSDNMAAYDADLARPLILQSTRQKYSEDMHRDYDGFDENEELSRLRRAVKRVKDMISGPDRPDNPKPHETFSGGRIDRLSKRVAEVTFLANEAVALLAFVTEAFDNIDEHLLRMGPLPKTWQAAAAEDLLNQRPRG